MTSGSTHAITAESGIPGQRVSTPTLSESLRQFASLQALFKEAVDDGSRVGIVSGPVGCGKTELLNAFSAHAAASGADVLLATASRAERAVPFGLLAHLLHGADIGPDLRSRAASWVYEAQSAPVSRSVVDGSTPDVAPGTFHGMCMTLLDIVERAPGPLVIGIDDAQYADVDSLRCLSFVVRRLRSARLLVVLNESLHARWPATLSQAELPAEPIARHFRLPLLSRQGVEDMMAEHLGPIVARTLADDAYDVSGGNPMLLRGLIEDNRNPVPPRIPVFRVADGFSQALISCVYRYEPEVRQVARRLAMLDEAPSLPVLARLAGLDTDNAAQALDLMRETGLLSNGLLRHSQASAALLGGMSAEERSAAQTHTANELFKNGSSVATVARHLVAADRLDSQCAIPVLHEAAEQALADGEGQFALDCLRLAHEYDADDRRRAAGMAMLVRATWRSNPYAAYRRLPSLTDDSMAGLLSGTRVSAAIDAFLWFGRPDEAAELIAREALEPLAAEDALTTSHLGASKLWLHAMYPGWAAGGPDDDEPSAWALGVAPELGAKRRAAAMLRANMGSGPNAAAVSEAQDVLRTYPLSEDTFTALLVPLQTLIYAERLREAHEWVEKFTAEAQRQSAPVWEAFFRSVGAEILLRKGQPQLAEQEVHEALALLPARNWGIALAMPLSTALHANALTGNESEALDEALSVLPAATFETPLGMRLLRARGHRSLENGQAAAALDDFLAVGEIAARHGADNPAAVPWRSSAALAYVRLGALDRARVLAAEELRMCGTRHPRVMAGALRVLAACSSGGEVLRLLGKAADQLENCDAPLELSLVLYDLGWALQEQGQYSKGRLMLRRARLMAEESGARVPARTVPVTATSADEGILPTELSPRRAGRLSTLSEAELRVVDLAIGSHSNRQIANQLFVTVSTVEQHLTRIYRKLGIKRRTDLAEAIRGARRSDEARPAC
ncbi:LuxR family transcriptional regulator [Streptomyces sp. AP-93]|uniref:helix-turn-helix transcriptional regulator n=1 Tax=Streptomyces sp. AP-93 TaxID=2929048 RepID=UPI001FAF5F59|nr:LuxR family transcriptional regulator [Streptomyces sp. AP-93]MCJ0873069.1 AAA family ATPase [Streptomyces sp. AP-93]